jgi:hypothetical protein
MLFAVRLDAMNGSETVLNLLDALIARIEDDIHELEIADADLLETSGWYKSCRPDRRNMLEKSAKASLHRAPRTRGPHLRRIEVQDENTAKSARSIANTPLQVLVENFESDGALVKFALKTFATKAAWELCFGAGAQCTPPALRIESPGGHGELPKLLNARLKEAADRGIEPRVVVIVDCDGEWVGDVKAYAKRIRDECAAVAVPCPPLNKRSAENYITDAVWRAWAAEPSHTNSRPAVDALLRLSYYQRDHVKIGPGNSDPWDLSNPKAVSLFANVSAQDWDLLKVASLKGRDSRAIASILETHKSILTRAEFLARDNQGDLEAVVRSIEDGL